MNKEKKLKKLAQTLLATTCLTAGAASTASAGTVDESMIDGGFGSSFATATLLSLGTTTVTGALCPDCSDTQDWFKIPGLNPGSSVSITESANAAANFLVENTTPTPLQSNNDVTTAGVNFNLTVPGDGGLVFRVSTFGESPFNATYEVDLVSSGAPEPSTFATGALALAAAAALRRKQKKA